jgi:hypothetical protein
MGNLILDGELAGDPAEKPGAGDHQDREAVEDIEHDRGAEHDRRDRDGDAENEQQQAALGGSSHRDDVVEAHHGIGHHDHPHRLPDRGRGGDAGLVLGFFGQHQLDGNPHQQRAAGEHQQGNAQQEHDDDGKDDPENDGRERAQCDAPAAVLRRQAAAGERNHQRIVTAQHDVDGDDLEQREPEARRDGFLHLTRPWRRLRRWAAVGNWQWHPRSAATAA